MLSMLAPYAKVVATMLGGLAVKGINAGTAIIDVAPMTGTTEAWVMGIVMALATYFIPNKA
jgi:hypothetical protein